MTTPESGLKRYNLVVATGLYKDLEALANQQQIPVVDLIRKFIKLGLYITAEMNESPDTALIIRNGETEREIVFL